MATPAAKAAQLAQIQGDIAAVGQTLDKAISQVAGKWFGGDSAQHVVDTLKGMRPNIDAWAARGTDAASSGNPPAGNGWAGWTAAGHIFIDGINDLTELGLTATITAITETAKDAPATSVAAAKKTVKAVKAQAVAIADKTTSAVTAVATGVTHTLYLALAIIVGAVVLRIYLLRKG